MDNSHVNTGEVFDSIDTGKMKITDMGSYINILNTRIMEAKDLCLQLEKYHNTYIMDETLKTKVRLEIIGYKEMLINLDEIHKKLKKITLDMENIKKVLHTLNQSNDSIKEDIKKIEDILAFGESKAIANHPVNMDTLPQKEIETAINTTLSNNQTLSAAFSNVLFHEVKEELDALLAERLGDSNGF